MGCPLLTCLDMWYNISLATDKACLLSYSPTCVKYWEGSSTLRGRGKGFAPHSRLGVVSVISSPSSIGKALAAHGAIKCTLQHKNVKNRQLCINFRTTIGRGGVWLWAPEPKYRGEGSSPLGPIKSVPMYALSSLVTCTHHAVLSQSSHCTDSIAVDYKNLT